jgi:hypothetical protein
MKVGRRLAMKVLNASKFVLGSVGAADPDPALVTEAVDRALLARLLTTCRTATTAFEAYDYTTALEVTERFFWEFCDDYLELVKERAYDESDPASASARAALACSLHTVLRLLAPFLRTSPRRSGPGGRRVRSTWPEWPAPHDGLEVDADPALLDAVAAALVGSAARSPRRRCSMRAPLARVEVTGPPALVEAASAAAADLRRAGHVQGDLVFTPATDATEISVAAELAGLTHRFVCGSMRLSSLALADESGRRAGTVDSAPRTILRRAASAPCPGSPTPIRLRRQRRKSHGSADESRAAGGSGAVARRAAVGVLARRQLHGSGMVRPADRARGGLRTLAAADGRCLRHQHGCADRAPA